MAGNDGFHRVSEGCWDGAVDGGSQSCAHSRPVPGEQMLSDSVITKLGYGEWFDQGQWNRESYM